MYAQDYDETYPRCFQYTNVAQTTYVYWPQLLDPYTKSTQLFNCPSSSYRASIYYGNYGANNLVLSYWNLEPIKMAAVQSASTTYMLTDAGNSYIIASSYVATASGTSYIPGVGANGVSCSGVSTVSPFFQSDCQSGRHFGGVNMAFADGHVKWLQTSTLLTEVRKGSYGEWNPAQ